MMFKYDHTSVLCCQVIAGYLIDKYADRKPSLVPATAELRARAALITRIADQYISPIQVSNTVIAPPPL